MKSSNSQTARMFKYMLEGGKLTALKALTDFDCLEFHARITEMREQFIIQDKWIRLENGKRIKEYWM